jgi:hypothetical protein
MRQPSFNLAYALSGLTPGTNLLAFCTAVGWLILRLPGALLALAAVDDLGLKYARSSRFRRQNVRFAYRANVAASWLDLGKDMRRNLAISRLGINVSSYLPSVILPEG